MRLLLEFNDSKWAFRVQFQPASPEIQDLCGKNHNLILTPEAKHKKQQFDEKTLNIAEGTVKYYRIYIL